MKIRLMQKLLKELREHCDRGVPYSLDFRPTAGLTQAQVARLQSDLKDGYDLWRNTWIMPWIARLESLVREGERPGKKAAARKAGGARYYTHAHNVEGCLRNGSYCRRDPDGSIVQYMNGDCMGDIDKIPRGMTEVPADRARELMPRCCR